jgi:hypothetical protein
VSRSPFLCLALIAALAAACSKTPEASPDPQRAPAPAATVTSTGATAPAPAKPGGGPSEVMWDAPAGWEAAQNPSPMRKATYKIKRADGDPEDAEMSVSQAGGSVEMNIKRWVSQFEQQPGAEPRRVERPVGDLKVTVVEIQGTFSGSGMPGMPAASPKPGWALLGAIVELPGGPGAPTWFFKLTGPQKTVSAAKSDFDKLVNSLRPK